jgi:hypothetical protein
MAFTTDLIRNVALAGTGDGKTILLEHLLFSGGAIASRSVRDGKTVSISWKKRSLGRSPCKPLYCHLNGRKKDNVQSTPPEPDFVGDVILAFRSAKWPC